MASDLGRRALHFVFKITNRNNSIDFYRNCLGMKVLRHEEFEEGCKATCNGPYDGKWSKTMIGFGDEDSNFVLELTYNYEVSNYKKGNEFLGIEIECAQDWLDNLKDSKIFNQEGTSKDLMKAASPCKYPFDFVIGEVSQSRIRMVTLACSDLEKSKHYWKELLKMNEVDSGDNYVTLNYGAKNQAKLKLQQITEPIDFGTASGRIAFSCPTRQLEEIQNIMIEANQKIIKNLISLDTPGKATVTVVILADPDGHEICFVGDESFRELSKTDPDANKLLDEAMRNDKSEEWFRKHNREKVDL